MATMGRSPGEEALSGLSGDALESFDEGFRGELLLPGGEGYEEARAVWNGMIDRHPAIVARCSGVADVVRAVEFGREQGLPVAVRGGGHNVAGTAVADGGIVVDCSAMTGVRVDPTRRHVRVEGGASLGDVDHETQLFGLATALGAVSQTGVAGLTLNGGYGHLSREHGLALDNLLSVDVVTADGAVLTASEEENEDLFWAVRGGGGNFGVVTSFEYALHEVGPEVYAFFVWFGADDSEGAMERYREWTRAAPREAGVLAFAAHVPDLEEFPEETWGEPAVAMLGSYRGDPKNAEEFFEPLLAEGTPVADFSGPMEYTDLQSMLDEDYPDGLRYYWKSVYLTEITDEVIDLVLRYNDSAPSLLSTVDIWHLGGAIGEVPREATAFWHRDKPYMVTFEANWEDSTEDEPNHGWAREGIEATQGLSVAMGGYGNFPGLNEDPVKSLFGGNYDRVVEVKSRYDPENLFRANVNVPPRPSA